MQSDAVVRAQAQVGRVNARYLPERDRLQCTITLTQLPSPPRLALPFMLLLPASPHPIWSARDMHILLPLSDL